MAFASASEKYAGVTASSAATETSVGTRMRESCSRRSKRMIASMRESTTSTGGNAAACCFSCSASIRSFCATHQPGYSTALVARR